MKISVNSENLGGDHFFQHFNCCSLLVNNFKLKRKLRILEFDFFFQHPILIFKPRQSVVIWPRTGLVGADVVTVVAVAAVTTVGIVRAEGSG